MGGEVEISVTGLSIGSLCAQVALEGGGASGMPVPPGSPCCGLWHGHIKGLAGGCCAQPPPRNLRLGRETKPGDINILLNGEILNVSRTCALPEVCAVRLKTPGVGGGGKGGGV